MDIELAPSLTALAEWIRAHDAHAARRLALLERAQTVLAGERLDEPARRRRLAHRLERWRYRLLDDNRDRPDPMSVRLADVLDLARARLCGRRCFPRSPRQAVHGCQGDPCVFVEALAALDPSLPLENVTTRARSLTDRHFRDPATHRRRILFYAPLYVSSYCRNECAYCGFRRPRELARRRLDPDEAVRQAAVLRGRGIRHVLLVAGDDPPHTKTGYFLELLDGIARLGLSAALEIAPQTTESYRWLAEAGACGVTLYQETYDERLYATYHPRGSKASYDWRLEGLERAAEAGIPRLGLGILLGLGRPRDELLCLMRHARYLQRRFPTMKFAFSLPRIHDAPEGFSPPWPVDDETFIRMFCALRIAFPTAELVLSTREHASLRDRLAPVCITQLSAGSSTAPGGYEDGAGDGPAESAQPMRRWAGQFAVADRRSPAEVAAAMRRLGLEPVDQIE